MFGKYSVNNLISEFQKNRHIIHSYVSGKSLEGYDDDDDKILGLSIGLFLIIFTIAIGIWIWALVAMLQNWDYLSDVAKIVAVLALLGPLGGPVVTLIIVYLMRKGNGKRSSVDIPMRNIGLGSPNSRYKYKSR